MTILRSPKVQAAVRMARNRAADLRAVSPSTVGRLPDFVIVGTMKAGTTSLAGNLKQHPQIFMPPREVRFFNDNWHEGIDWYRQIFAPGAGKVCGEKTPDYMRVGRYMKRMRRVVPDAKIIVLLRDPVARLLSEINHRISAGRLPAADQIDGDYVRKVIFGDPLRRRRILDRGFYLKQIQENVLPYFPQERVLIRPTDERARSIDRAQLKASRLEGQLTGEDGSGFTLQLLNDVCDFLEVEPFTGTEPFVLSGVRDYSAPATRGARKMVYDLYAEQNARLFEFLGLDIPAWREDISVGN